MLGDEHNTAFTVAKMMDTDLLSTVQDKLTAAIDSGTTLSDFKKQLIPDLQSAGWWGKKDVIDPLTGMITEAQLGSASRLETIFKTNLQSAYSVGQWEAIQENAQTAPYLMYDAVDDHYTRPEHAARDGEVHPVYSKFWQSHFPPNGWNCRCGVIQLDDDDLQEMGLTPIKNPSVTTYKWQNPRTGATLNVPVDVDPGWDHNPGKARMDTLNKSFDDKLKQLIPGQQRRIRKAISDHKVSRHRHITDLQQTIANSMQRQAPDLASTEQAGKLTSAMNLLETATKPTRANWATLPGVAIAANEQTARGHPDYPPAKAGDVEAAAQLVSDVIGDKYLNRLRRLIRKSEPLLVPVHALETESVNPIPAVMAEYLASALELHTNLDIMQANRVGHTKASGFHRLATPALFEGDVLEGADYLIIDDFVGQGGTLANIRGYIESKGGNVIGLTTLTGQRRSGILALQQSTLDKLRNKHEELEKWWQEVFGYGFGLLTESEARYLLRSQDADTIRESITAAARQGDQRDGPKDI